MKNNYFKTEDAVAMQSEAMESGDHRLLSVAEVKNGASPKSHTSRGKIYSKFRIVIVAGIVMLFYTSCVIKRVTPVAPVNPFEFLKGERVLNVVLNFEDVLLQGVPEKSYLQGEQPEWVEHWEEAKFTVFEENFMAHLNNNLRIRCGNYPDARYQATVFVLSVDRKGPGKHLEGPGIREVNCEVIFTKTDDSYPLATINAKGNSQGTSQANNSVFGSRTTIGTIIASAGSNTQLAGKAFSYMGQNLGKQIADKIK